MTEAPRPRVLIADDETHIRALVKALMKTMKVDVAGEAKNGREAVDMHRELKPDLTFLDINMPVLGGDEALKEIIGDAPDALVIMLTSIADTEVIEKCLDLGAAGYMLKDTPLEEMKKIVKETWDERRRKR